MTDVGPSAASPVHKVAAIVYRVRLHRLAEFKRIGIGGYELEFDEP